MHPIPAAARSIAPSAPPAVRHRRGRSASGFTLIELLVVISIIAGLLGMLMPMLSIADRQAKASATRAVMAKVDVAARLFRDEIGAYPYQSSYANIGSGAAWTNRLYYQLGSDIAASDRSNILADGDAAAALYRTDGSGNGLTPYAFTKNDSFEQNQMMANRMAAERARLAIYSGNPGITGPTLRIPYYNWRDFWNGHTHVIRRIMPTTPLLASPASAANPGMARNYLQGELEAKYISGTAVLDAWGRPLIYVCQVTEGMVSAMCLEAGPISCDALDLGLEPLGRTTLVGLDSVTGQPSLDAITQKPVVADPTWLPDLGNLRNSDRRYYAPRGLELEFEVWSAGRDGLADWMRSAAVNNDNVSLLPYDKSIP